MIPPEVSKNTSLSSPCILSLKSSDMDYNYILTGVKEDLVGEVKDSGNSGISTNHFPPSSSVPNFCHCPKYPHQYQKHSNPNIYRHKTNVFSNSLDFKSHFEKLYGIDDSSKNLNSHVLNEKTSPDFENKYLPFSPIDSKISSQSSTSTLKISPQSMCFNDSPIACTCSPVKCSTNDFTCDKGILDSSKNHCMNLISLPDQKTFGKYVKSVLFPSFKVEVSNSSSLPDLNFNSRSPKLNDHFLSQQFSTSFIEGDNNLESQQHISEAVAIHHNDVNSATQSNVSDVLTESSSIASSFSSAHSCAASLHESFSPLISPTQPILPDPVYSSPFHSSFSLDNIENSFSPSSHNHGLSHPSPSLQLSLSMPGNLQIESCLNLNSGTSSRQLEIIT
jgi:hypothetical protein